MAQFHLPSEASLAASASAVLARMPQTDAPGPRGPQSSSREDGGHRSALLIHLSPALQDLANGRRVYYLPPPGKTQRGQPVAAVSKR